MVGSLANRWINKGAQIVAARIELVEARYNAEYVADLCLRDDHGNWTDEPFAVFWTPILTKPEYTHYFGLQGRNGQVFVVNGISITEGFWEGAEADNGEIIFSRFRHDNRVSSDETAMVDGGRDYFRYRGRPVRLRVVGPDFEIVE